MKPENQTTPMKKEYVENYNNMVTHLNNELRKNKLVNLSSIVETYGYKAEKKGNKKQIVKDGQAQDIKDISNIVDRHNRDVIRTNTQQIVPFKRTAIILATAISPLAGIAMIIANRTTKRHIVPVEKPVFRPTDRIKPMAYRPELENKAVQQKETKQKEINHPLLAGKQDLIQAKNGLTAKSDIDQIKKISSASIAYNAFISGLNNEMSKSKNINLDKLMEKQGMAKVSKDGKTVAIIGDFKMDISKITDRVEKRNDQVNKIYDKVKEDKAILEKPVPQKTFGVFNSKERQELLGQQKEIRERKVSLDVYQFSKLENPAAKLVYQKERNSETSQKVRMDRSETRTPQRALKV